MTLSLATVMEEAVHIAADHENTVAAKPNIITLDETATTKLDWACEAEEAAERK